MGVAATYCIVQCTVGALRRPAWRPVQIGEKRWVYATPLWGRGLEENGGKIWHGMVWYRRDGYVDMIKKYQGNK